ncbi:hypothetical protein EJ06DRAFT_105517 [Trichodelitschia bisporula]|uniref:Uncharacterized protein n=1 Tax=Trichodelitschia bisporula TaxID=703511 RepID=A0A6G1HRA6_9PEZI|nr:hypothetical protein EJ06DRAFT_105517 [Trichodelitschia bisporula]
MSARFSHLPQSVIFVLLLNPSHLHPPSFLFPHHRIRGGTRQVFHETPCCQPVAEPGLISFGNSYCHHAFDKLLTAAACSGTCAYTYLLHWGSGVQEGEAGWPRGLVLQLVLTRQISAGWDTQYCTAQVCSIMAHYLSHLTLGIGAPAPTREWR